MIKDNSQDFHDVLPFLKDIVISAPSIFGSALAIEPTSVLGQIYCKYYYKSKNSVREKYLLPPKYDYLNSSWYKNVKESRKPTWSEPYYDKGGGEVFMSTYSFPIEDLDNEFLGVVTADIELATLDRKIQELTKMEEGFVTVVSQKGLIISHPDKKYSLKKYLDYYAKDVNSKKIAEVFSEDKEKNGGVHNISLNGEEYIVHTMHIPQTSWIVGVFLKKSILFKPLSDLQKKLIIISIVGLLLILFMVITVSNQLKISVAKDEKIKHELTLASRIQQSFLPKKSTIITQNFSLSGVMKSAKEVGGDFYGYRYNENQLLFYLGDVSGKGVPASLFMMASVMLIEDAIDNSFEPSYITKIVNNKLCNLSTQGMFATLIVGVIDFETMELDYCTAGHPPFLVKEADSVYTPMPEFYPPICTFEDLEYKSSSLKLNKNSTIAIFSDGVSEAGNSKKELYGTENLTKELSFIEDKSSEDIKREILKNIKFFTKDEPQSDDLTLIVITI
ncbi:MAG: SpoIIE family protein phosphatase [Campylobacterales bacterium]